MLDAAAILGEIELIDTQIDVKLREIDRLWERATCVTQRLAEVKVATSGGSGAMSESVNRIVDLSAEINADVGRLVLYKRKVHRALDRIKNPDYVKVLYKRCFEFKKWEQIGHEMNMSSRNAQRYYERALPVFLELWQEAEKDAEAKKEAKADGVQTGAT